MPILQGFLALYTICRTSDKTITLDVVILAK